MDPRLPEPLLHFVAHFNAGEFWESHEVLEGPWRADRSGFYHGLILYASAFVHAQRGNPRGVEAQLNKTERKLTAYRPAYLGLDVDQLLTHAARCRALAAAQLPVPFPSLHIDPTLVRGDEPELSP